MASGLTSSSEPIEPTQVWTAEEWNDWMNEPKSRHRDFRKTDMFRRLYSPLSQVWSEGTTIYMTVDYYAE